MARSLPFFLSSPAQVQFISQHGFLFVILSLFHEAPFSPTRPYGPSWSSRCDVHIYIYIYICPLPMQYFLRPGSDGGGEGKKKKKKKINNTTSSNLYWSYYPHRSKELVSPVCGIFLEYVQKVMIRRGQHDFFC